MDAEMPSVYEQSKPTARKEHKCCECKRKIKIGERYVLSRGKWEGVWATFKTCLECHLLRIDLGQGEDNPPFGELAEWAKATGIEFPVEDAKLEGE